jgi:hypothetical protein
MAECPIQQPQLFQVKDVDAVNAVATNGTANINAAADISAADLDAYVCNREAPGHQREVSLAQIL